MEISNIGFAVIYRWRLHLADDGTWVAYAQWPTRRAWEESRERGPIEVKIAEMMRDAIEEAFEPVLLEPVRDYLLPSNK